MPGCALRYCTNFIKKRHKSDGVTYHRFPTDDEIRNKWIKFVQKNRSEETWLPTKNSCICSQHFKEDDKYTTQSGRLFLKKIAVPLENPIKLENEPGTSTPLSEAVSDESVFDSLRIDILKKKLRKQTLARKKLAEKLKTTLRQNRYLRRKCDCYKILVRNLKDKIADLNAD